MKNLFLFMVLAFPVFSFAAPCQNAKDVADFETCAFRQEEAAMRTLTSTYRRALAKVRRDTERGDYEIITPANRLIESQRRWWEMKDFECQNEMWNFGSTGTGAAALCRREKILLRERELRQLYLK